MTDSDEDRSLVHIETCRRVNRRAAAMCAEQGVALDDVAIAAIYTALDLATTLKGCPVAAVVWLRTAVDVQERSLLTGQTIQ